MAFRSSSDSRMRRGRLRLVGCCTQRSNATLKAAIPASAVRLANGPLTPRRRILHNSVFSVLDLFIAIALFGLARAGVAAGVTPRAFAWLAPIGTALLLV